MKEFCFYLLAIIAFLTLISLSTYKGIHDFKTFNSAKNWVTVPCLIDKVYFELQKKTTTYLRHGDIKTDTETNPVWKIWYMYNYEGQTYKSDCYGISTHEKEFTTEETEQLIKSLNYKPRGPFSPGDKTVCYVNPANPSESALDLEYADCRKVVLPLLGLVIVGSIVGIGIFIRNYYCYLTD